eukprot:8553615-Lingulodinium_polyedra.AAC.1
MLRPRRPQGRSARWRLRHPRPTSHGARHPGSCRGDPPDLRGATARAAGLCLGHFNVESRVNLQVVFGGDG